MKKSLLATVAIAALIAGPALAQRQEAPAGDTKGAAPPPASIQKAPAEKVAPPAGKASPDRAAEDTKAPKAGTTGQASPSDRPAEPGAKPRSGADTKSDMKARPDAKPDRSTTGQATPSGKPAASEKADDKPGMKADTKPAPNAQRSGATTDTKASVNAASLTTEQRTKIRTTVLTANAPRVTNVNFSVNVGTVVPRTVRLVAVPAPLIDIHPAWRGYMYFVHGDRIVIVEPGTLRIVTILEV
jgi:uncharacterized protein DUF1236